MCISTNEDELLRTLINVTPEKHYCNSTFEVASVQE